MTAPSLTNDTVEVSVVPYTNFRIALATAILGSAGASLAWLGYLAYEARDWQLVIAVVVGAALGFIVHWLQHYVRTAAREQRGEAAAHHSPNHPLIALLWAAGFGFLALASEHLVAHMVAEFLRPFLASLASLVPAGAIIGWSMSRGRSQDKNLFQFLAEGLFIGGSIAAVTGIIWTITFGSAPWFALVSWWGLIGIGTHLMTRPERNAVKISDPIAAVAIVFVGTFLINLLPTTMSSYDKLGAFKGPPVLIRIMAAEIQESPGVPATFWVEAEKRLADEHAKSEGTHVALQGVLPQRPDTSKQLIRSWLVILFFALGVGAAPAVERALRPIDYPNSETYRRDITLTLSMVALLVVACLIGRYAK